MGTTPGTFYKHGFFYGLNNDPTVTPPPEYNDSSSDWENWTQAETATNPWGGATAITTTGTHPDGLRLTVDSSISGPYTLTQTFTIKNEGSGTVSDLIFSDYFNAHPSGFYTGTPGQRDGYLMTIATYDSSLGQIKFVPDFAALNARGLVPATNALTMHGERLPDYYAVGSTGDVIGDPIYGNFNGSSGPYVGNGAGALGWDLGDLAAGESTSFTITKNITPVPEPETYALMLAGLAAVGFVARRRKAGNAACFDALRVRRSPASAGLFAFGSQRIVNIKGLLRVGAIKTGVSHNSQHSTYRGSCKTTS